jgi:hypothetical protein
VFEVGGADGELFAVVGAEGALFGADDVGFMVGEFVRPSYNRPGRVPSNDNLYVHVLADVRCPGRAGCGLVVCFVSNEILVVVENSGLPTRPSIVHRRWQNAGF